MSKSSESTLIAKQKEYGVAGFDFWNTHEFDRKSKRLASKNPYRMFVIKGEQIVEWPVGSGNAWFPDKKFAGRLEVKHDHHGNMMHEFVRGADHKEFVPPITEDQALAKDVLQTKEENARLKAELAAIKAEQDKKSKPAPSASKG